MCLKKPVPKNDSLNDGRTHNYERGRMTLNQLHKQLGALIDKGHGRRQVCIDKRSFQHNLEPDGCVILPVCRTDTRWIVELDGDGCAVINKDGSEHGETTVILGGSSYPVSEGA